jgi:ribosome biogenesis GTPase
LARTLEDLGWDETFARHAAEAEPGLLPARVIAEQRGAYRVLGADGERWAAPAGRLRRAAGPGALPAVGDWVLARRAPDGDRATIQRVLPRRSAFSRRAAGQDAAQVVAANVDVVLIVTSLNRELSARRLERYLTLAWNSGAVPAVVLSKADLCPDPAAVVAELAPVARGVPLHVTSVRDGRGLDELRAHLAPGRTLVLLGSSGVGKSTLVNALAGSAVQEVQDTLADDRGRHTTTSRQMVFVPGGGMIVDTPGMREVGLVGDEDALARAFDDVAELAARCRFADCRHAGEPGCAVREALDGGALPADRWESYVKLQRELALQGERGDALLAQQSKARTKGVHRAVKDLHRQRRR